jgi:Skp family chaperone for outer membrane proteins
VVNTVQSQTRGTKIGYIDMEYILQNVPTTMLKSPIREMENKKLNQESRN